MIHRHFAIALAALFCAGLAHAQTLTIRDTIVALPPISICQDGATHVTVCTNHRLRPQGFGSLAPFVGQPIEITGTPGAITCSYVDVQNVTVLTNEQTSSTTTTAATMTVDFFGAGATGDLYLLFVAPGLQATPTMFPPFLGPVHLDPALTSFVGVFLPQGPNTAYYSLTFPFNSAAIGVPFFDQCLVVHANLVAETTVVDCFTF